MDLDKTLQRYAIVSAYINNQTDESWERMKATIRRLERHDDNLFREAVNGLVEFHPELKDRTLVASIRTKVSTPDTGNRQADYQNVRDQVERLVQEGG
jgi:pyrroloquinoline quinone (PQQ) biosynthesis protein C